MSKYLYGRAIWCGDELNDYAFDSKHLKLSDSRPTKVTLIKFIADFIKENYDLKGLIHIELDYESLCLDEFGTSDTFTYVIDFEDEILTETVRVIKVEDNTCGGI